LAFPGTPHRASLALSCHTLVISSAQQAIVASIVVRGFDFNAVAIWFGTNGDNALPAALLTTHGARLLLAGADARQTPATATAKKQLSP
jgi:hypothetical protein